MRLRIVLQARWKILTGVAENGRCELLEFLSELTGAMASDRDRVLRRLRTLAEVGSIRNEEQSRKVEGADAIFELKGDYVRIFYFFRAGQLIVCSHAVLKPKKKQVLAEARKAMALREEIDRAERNGVLVIEEEKG